ncbi:MULTISPECIES: hypothetical protein [unclassified Paenibacillus]|uniref:hypothetical protein n=1 Tax=unclassified Paenibacillus TaxID=185978 RepID=UPI001AE32D86|nr:MULTISPECIES: hypothetical protein [unclassified Paenibacillus]MBP1154674.1 hypothetical protein [Paenibacillus sp. PvP091]MBP1169942.1 hypothetical protein [Paenibacillus sp. PvR098]MBP2440970.1 hypothetical protein [Paenibacillus sp. PvP052]
MKKLICVVTIVLLLFTSLSVQADNVVPYEEQWQSSDSGSYVASRYRSGRGSFTGGRTGGVAPGTGTAPRTPAGNVRNNPGTTVPPGGAATAPARGMFGGLFGGLAMGALLGSIFNPFGFFGGMPFSGFSIIGLLFWGAILFLVYRLFKRARRNS